MARRPYVLQRGEVTGGSVVGYTKVNKLYSVDRPAPTIKTNAMSNGGFYPEIVYLDDGQQALSDPEPERRPIIVQGGYYNTGLTEAKLKMEKVFSIDRPAPTVSTFGLANGIRPPDIVWTTAPQVEEPDTVEKPPYAIPSMEEIDAIPWNGLKVVSTFSGCGGSCLGFRMAGYRIAYANEFVEAARDTYRANSTPETFLDHRDIRTVSAESIRELAGIGAGEEVDVLEGSPPCASFSTAGKRHKGWGKVKAYSETKQRSDDLFFEYARLLGDLRPKAFVAENVSGLVKGTAKGYYKEIMEALRAAGYRVGSRLLDAQWLGVPQARVRLIIVGFREDLDLEPADAFPTPLPYRYSIREAIPWLGRVVWNTSGKQPVIDITEGTLPTLTVGDNNLSQYHFVVRDQYLQTRIGAGPTYPPNTTSLDSPAPLVMANGIDGAGIHQHALENDIRPYAIYKEWERLAPGESSEVYHSLRRTHPDRPSSTVLASGGVVGAAGVTHPFEPRKFTMEELRRLCGFPDDFALTGTYQQQWERLGRAVPPPMMAAVARGIARSLTGGS